MIIRNTVVYYGVGMTIGSVPPHDDGPYGNCIQNITFENIVMHHPIKAIYIKSNPGDKGKGLVNLITYRNLTGHFPLW
jgi:hypothetical protein